MVGGDAGNLEEHCCGDDCPGLMRARWLRFARSVVPEIERLRAEHAARNLAARQRVAVLLCGRPALVTTFWQVQASSRGAPRT
jgi:hypothetical protein